MIYLIEELPCLLVNGDFCEIKAMELNNSLLCAASNTGYKDWWLIDHLLDSVITYLKQFYSGKFIFACEIEKLLKSALEGMGYSDIADKYTLDNSISKISLLDIASLAEYGYELSFYNLLEKQIKDSAFSRKYYKIVDLQKCIKKLKSTKKWSRKCEVLKYEIISHIRLLCLKYANNTKISLILS